MMSARQSTRTASDAKRFARLFARLCALLMLTGMLSLPALAQDEAASPTPVPVPQQQMAQPAEPPLPAKTTLRGHVAYENNGRPVRRARLYLLKQVGNGSEKMALTDARGDFQIKEVPAGKYYIMVDAPGIVTPISLMEIEQLDREGVQSPEVEKQFELYTVDGINDKQVEVRVRRGGSISGRVTYEDGDPVVNARVSIMRLKNGHLSRFMTNISPAAFLGHLTDDRGMYRFNGLPPGEYVVSASESIEHGTTRHSAEDEFYSAFMGGEANTLVATYYQSATNARAATPVKIEASEEENNIDITLVERALHNITGTVIARSDKRPLPHAHIRLIRKGSDSTADSGQLFMESQPDSETDELGQWFFKEIPDGEYNILVQPQYEPPQAAPNAEESAEPGRVVSHSRKKLSQKQQAVKVAGEDITNLVIEMAQGARLTGTVIVEGGKQLTERTVIYAHPVGAEVVTSTYGQVDENGRFVIDGVPPGKVYLNVSIPDSGYYAKSITVGGVDVLHEPLTTQEGAEITDVRVLLSNESGTLSGRVRNEAGEPVPAATAFVLLYPVDQAQWNRPGAVLSATPVAKGAYSVSGPPGEYYVLVVDLDDIPVAASEEYIKSRVTAAPRVRLQANEQKSMDLTAPRAK